MDKSVLEQAFAIQESMVESGRSWNGDGLPFSEWVLDHLRCVVGLTVEFSHYLQRIDMPPRGVSEEVSYKCESIFRNITRGIAFSG